MTTLKDQLKNDLVIALKAHDEFAKTVLRSVLSGVQEQEKSGKVEGELTDAQVQDVLKKAVKVRQKVAAEYLEKGAELSDPDAVARSVERSAAELREVDFLNQYLPKGLSEEEVAAFVAAAFGELDHEATMRDLGKIVGAVKTASAGAADGKLVSDLAKARING